MVVVESNNTSISKRARCTATAPLISDVYWCTDCFPTKIFYKSHSKEGNQLLEITFSYAQSIKVKDKKRCTAIDKIWSIYFQCRLLFYFSKCTLLSAIYILIWGSLGLVLQKIPSKYWTCVSWNLMKKVMVSFSSASLPCLLTCILYWMQQDAGPWRMAFRKMPTASWEACVSWYYSLHSCTAPRT